MSGQPVRLCGALLLATGAIARRYCCNLEIQNSVRPTGFGLHVEVCSSFALFIVCIICAETQNVSTFIAVGTKIYTPTPFTERRPRFSPELFLSLGGIIRERNARTAKNLGHSRSVYHYPYRPRPRAKRDGGAMYLHSTSGSASVCFLLTYRRQTPYFNKLVRTWVAFRTYRLTGNQWLPELLPLRHRDASL